MSRNLTELPLGQRHFAVGVWQRKVSSMSGPILHRRTLVHDVTMVIVYVVSVGITVVFIVVVMVVVMAEEPDSEEKMARPNPGTFFFLRHSSRSVMNFAKDKSGRINVPLARSIESTRHLLTHLVY